MPCYDSRSADLLPDAKKEIDRLTDMLCRALKHGCELDYSDGSAFDTFPEDIKAWYEKHKKEDEKRNV